MVKTEGKPQEEPVVRVRWHSESRERHRVKKAASAQSAASAPNEEHQEEWAEPLRILTPHSMNGSEWTEKEGDVSEEQKTRVDRNTQIKAWLQDRYTVQFQVHGEMMMPRVFPDYYCLIEPATSNSQLRQGDVVFAEVQPDMFRCQPILKIERGPTAVSAHCTPPGDLVDTYYIGGEMEYCITCDKHHMNGRLFEVIVVTAASAPEASTASS